MTEYQSYYIVNAVHAVITSKELIKQIAELPNVEKITPNNKIELVEPVEDDEEPETASYSVRNSILNRMKRTLNGEYPWSTRIKCGTISISMEKALP